mgnify:CR=1 FL=1
MAEVGVGKKRRRRSSTDGKKKKKRRVTIEEKKVEEVDLAGAVPEKKKSRYQLLDSSSLYEIACGDAVVQLPEVQDDNTELWVFQFPKTVRICLSVKSER